MALQPVGPSGHSASVEDRIAALGRRPSAVYQSSTVTAYARVSDELHAMYWFVPAQRLYPVVVAAMRMERGQRGSREPVNPAAGLAMLAGRIAYLDFDHGSAADGHQLEAIGLAYLARDPQAAAAALTHRADIESQAGGHERAHRLMDEANAVLSGVGMAGRTQLQRVWQDMVSAQVAVRGDDGSRAIDLLRVMSGRMRGASRAEAPRWLDFFDGSRLAGVIGAAELRAGQPERAALMLRSSLRTSSRQAAKEMSVVFADLADARRMQSDFAEACQWLTRAMDLVEIHDYMVGLRRVNEVRRALPSTVETASVSALDLRLSTWDGVLARLSGANPPG